MKTFFALLLLTAVVSAQQNSKITFILHAPTLSEKSNVFITGSTDELGNWNPGDVAMDFTGNSTWQVILEMNTPQPVEYKYTLGSWDKEAADSAGFPLKNFNVTINTDTIIKNEVSNWTNGTKKVITGLVSGQVEYIRSVQGKALHERDLVIWLPPDYEKSEQRYPVLYMHDGQNIFDSRTSAFGVDWQADETADSLICSGEIPPLIIVGIYNTQDRGDEYLPGSTSEAYMNLIINNIKPLIDTKYRTLQGRENTYTGGSSAGGIISFMMVWEHPDVFSKALCFSPAFKIDRIDYVSKVIGTERRDNVYFYIYNGGLGTDIRLRPGVEEMLQALKQKGYKEGKDFYYDEDLSSEHFESAWAKHFPLALKILFKKSVD